MSKSIMSRRNVLQAGAAAGAGLALPTILTAGSHSGYLNAPTGSTVTLGFNVPQSGPYADEGADELRAYMLAVEHLNGGGDGGMMNTFSSKALQGNGILGKKVEYVTGDTQTKSDAARASAKSMIEKDGAIMSESERGRLERDILSKRRELKRDQDEFREDVNFRRNEEFGKIQKQIVEAIRKVAADQKYDLVLGEGVIYASKTVDITDAVIKTLRVRLVWCRV